MLYTIPDYYKEFVCTAGECEDTCCAGWQIVIDRNSLRKYGKVRGKFRKKLNSGIHWVQGTFRQDSEKRCAFLNEENLCDMYTALGKESLCRTCRLYPRHVEEFEGVREITLSISCPEAAKLLLGKKEPVTFLSYEKEGEEEYEDFDLLLYSKLTEGRDVILRILQDRTKDLRVRTGLVLGIAHDMQGRINRGELFTCDEVFETYQKPEAAAFIEKKRKEEKKDLSSSYKFITGMFLSLYRLELLREDWGETLKEADVLLYEGGREGYWKVKEEFESWLKDKMPDFEIQCEQLLVYFIFTYFCGAVYDGRVYAKVQMAVVSVMLMKELLLARFIKNEKMLDMEDIIEVVYRFSREIEHSDKNLEEMEKIMEEQLIPWFVKK